MIAHVTNWLLRDQYSSGDLPHIIAVNLFFNAPNRVLPHSKDEKTDGWGGLGNLLKVLWLTGKSQALSPGSSALEAMPRGFFGWTC